MLLKQIMLFIYMVWLFTCCKQHPNSDLTGHVFADTPTSAPIQAGFIDEASGIADSRTNNGFLWVEQDSGNPPELSLLAHNGSASTKTYLKGLQNRDWEDLAIARGPDPSAYYIYLAEIGDNFLQHKEYYIYRFREPAAFTDTVFSIDKIAFKYPDGSNNAEAIFVDNGSKDIFIITKSDLKTSVYKLPYPQNATGITEASLVGSLALSVVVGAAISPDGKEIIVKTYNSLNYWKRSTGETIEEVLKKPSTRLDYKAEIQGEAVGFKNDNSGFFTLSEKVPVAAPVTLNFYRRN